MKSKIQKYQEAVRRNLPRWTTSSAASSFSEVSLEALKIKVGVRKADKDHDEILNQFLKASKAKAEAGAKKAKKKEEETSTSTSPSPTSTLDSPPETLRVPMFKVGKTGKKSPSRPSR